MPDEAIEVLAEAGIGPDDKGGFRLSVLLGVHIRRLDQASAEDIVQAAHRVCPYSNAVRDNVDVGLSVVAR